MHELWPLPNTDLDIAERLGKDKRQTQPECFTSGETPLEQSRPLSVHERHFVAGASLAEQNFDTDVTASGSLQNQPAKQIPKRRPWIVLSMIQSLNGAISMPEEKTHLSADSDSHKTPAHKTQSSVQQPLAAGNEHSNSESTTYNTGSDTQDANNPAAHNTGSDTQDANNPTAPYSKAKVVPVSGPLGNDGDFKRFVAMRRLCDVVLVGANTVSAEQYKRVSTQIAVVSGSLSLDPSLPLFQRPSEDLNQPELPKPLIFTTESAYEYRSHLFSGTAEVISLGSSITATAILDELTAREKQVVMLEGGSKLNTLFAEADLIDEALISIAPLMIMSESQPMVGPSMLNSRCNTTWILDRVIRSDSHLLLRYLRDRGQLTT